MSEALRKAALQAHELLNTVESIPPFHEVRTSAMHALRAALAEPEQSEPVAWMHEDELPKSYPYDLMYPHSKVDGVRLFPVFAPPAQTKLPLYADPFTYVIQHLNSNPYALTKDECVEMVKKLRAKYQQAVPAQGHEHSEPVAYADPLDLAKDTNWDNFTVKHASEWHEGLRFKVPLYAAPPRREPLTDEQLWTNDVIMSLNADLGWHMETIRMFARAIEAAHGIGVKP